jgi:gliding motility-associated-like protein
MTVTNSTGCVTTTSFPNIIEAYPVPVANFDAEPKAATIDNPVISFSELIQGDYSYIEWDFGDGVTSSEQNPKHTYTLPGNYDVIMYTENTQGCADSDTLNIGILTELRVFIPSAFSPNSDGLNDCFSISGTTGDIINSFRLQVFDRWGSTVYNSIIESADCIWDGRDSEGKVLPADTYIYRITGSDMQGGRKVFEGSVTIYL